MAAYWWQCEKCSSVFNFDEVSDSRGITHFIWDVLVPSSWNQANLVKKCKKCGKSSLRMAYEFPRADKVTLLVFHMVGLGPFDDVYIPMMWETKPLGSDEANWFDFKYINGRNLYGLNKPAVFTRDNLEELFSLYKKKTGHSKFP